MGSDVESVECDGPGAATVRRGFPKLAHLLLAYLRPGDAVLDSLAGRVDGLARQDHSSIVKSAVKLEQFSPVIHPRLVPLLSRCVVDVVTVAPASARPAPIFVKNAAAQRALNSVCAGSLSIRRAHLPVAYPEIELVVLGGAARTGRLR